MTDNRGMRAFPSLLLLTALAGLAQDVPPPALTSLSPGIVTVGSPAFTLRVTGARFTQESRVVWRHGAATAVTLPTTFVSDTRLDAAVSPALLTQIGAVPVAVVQGNLVSNPLDFFVVEPVAITTACPLPNGITGRAYSLPLTLRGGRPPYVWSIAAGVLPPGLVLTPNGVITGTPTTATQAVFTLRVTDDQQNSATADCTMRVIAAQPGQTLFITALEPSAALLNSADTTIVVRGSGFVPGVVAVWNSTVDLPTTFEDASRLTAIIPARLLTSLGSFPITVRRIVLTAREFSNPENFSVIGQPQLVTSCPLPDATLNQPYQQTLVATSGFPPYSWRLAQGQLPQGITLSATGVLAGTPVEAGAFPFSVEIIDSRSNLTSRPCSLRVLGPLTASPSSITFVADAGGETPPPQYLSLFTGAPDVPLLVQFTSTSGNWLQPPPLAHQTPALIPLRVTNFSTLAPGTYSGVITVTTDAAASRSLTIPVSLTIRPPRAAAIQAEPASLAVASPRDSNRVLHHLITLSNPANTALIFSAASSASWLTVTPSAGSVIANSPALLRLRISPSNLEPGAYRAEITVTSPGLFDPLRIPVTLVVASSPELLSVSPPGITLRSVHNGPPPPPAPIYVSGLANSTFFWEATPGAEWLSVSPPSDAARPDAPSSPSLQVSSSALPPDIHFSELRFASPAADNSPRLIGVAAEVLPASTPLLEIQPAGLLFTSGPVRQTINIRNLSNLPLPVDLNLTGETRVFTIFPRDGRVIPPGESRLVEVEANAQGLPSGAYRASLLIHPSTASQVHAVDLLMLARPNLTCTPARLHPLVTSPAAPFSIAGGLPLRLEVRVADDCGVPPSAGAVLAGGAPLTQVRPGFWVGTWTPPISAGPVVIPVFVDDPLRNLQGATQLAGTVTPSPGIPRLNDSGVTSAASFLPGAPLAPGSLFAAFGLGLVEGSPSLGGVPWPETLATTSLSIGGRPAPLLFAASQPLFSQINGQVPYDIRPNTLQQVAVTVARRRSQYLDLPIAAAQPSVFTLSQSGSGQGIVVDGNRPTVIVDPNNPVPRGGVIVIYAEGLGLLNQSLNAGQPAPADPLARVAGAVSVTIASQPAEVLFAGLTPGFVGLYQINAVVPPGIAPGAAVPLTVSVAGQTSRPVTIAVR